MMQLSARISCAAYALYSLFIRELARGQEGPNTGKEVAGKPGKPLG